MQNYSPTDAGGAFRFVLVLVLLALLPAVAFWTFRLKAQSGPGPGEPVKMIRLAIRAALQGDEGEFTRWVNAAARTPSGAPRWPLQEKFRVISDWAQERRGTGETLSVGRILHVEPRDRPAAAGMGPGEAAAVFLEIRGAAARYVLKIGDGNLVGGGRLQADGFTVEAWEWQDFSSLAADVMDLEGRALLPLLRSRISNNEAAAIHKLRTIVTSQEQYKSTDGAGRYADLSTLHAAQPPFIDAALSSGKVSGYSFVGAADGGTNFTFHAAPIRPGRTGNRRFFTDSSGVIRSNASGDATSGVTPPE